MENKEIEAKEIKDENKTTTNKELDLVYKKQDEFEKLIVPDGIYPATFQGYLNIPDGKFGRRIILNFEIEHEQKKKLIGRIVYAKLASNSTLTKLMIPLGYEPEEGQPIKINELIGNKCNLFLKQITYEKDNKEITKSNIQDVIKHE